MSNTGPVFNNAVSGAGAGSLFGPVGTGIGAVIGGISGLWNTWQQKKNLDYQKQVQQKTWQREDTAQQRAVADLRSAGLSPTLAAGHGSPTSSPVRTDAPQFDASAALALMKMKQDISRTAAETRLINANAKVAEATVPSKIGKASQELRLMDIEEAVRKGKITAQEYRNIVEEMRMDGGYYQDLMEIARRKKWITGNQREMSDIELELMKKYADPAKALGITGQAASQVGAILEMIMKITGKNRVYR